MTDCLVLTQDRLNSKKKIINSAYSDFLNTRRSTSVILGAKIPRFDLLRPDSYLLISFNEHSGGECRMNIGQLNTSVSMFRGDFFKSSHRITLAVIG